MATLGSRLDLKMFDHSGFPGPDIFHGLFKQ